MRMRWTLLGLVLATMLVMTATAAPSVIAQGAKKTIKLSMVSYKFTPDPPARMMGDFPIITVNRGDTVVFQISNDDPDRRNHSFAARWLMNIQVQARGQFRTGEADERRFFAAGDVLRAVPSRLGVGLGLAVCEDFWHLPVAQLLALDGAQVLVNVSSSPGRDLAATHEVGLGTATSWRTLMRTYAQLTTSFAVFCNRVGVDESISFWGGSEVIGPTGEAIFSAPLYDEGLFCVDIRLEDVRRERIALPLLRDERPEWNVRELDRIVAERAGFAADTTAEPGAGPGLDVAPEAARETVG